MIHSIDSVTTALSRFSHGQTLARSLAGTRYVDFPNGPGDKGWRRRNAEAIRSGSIEPRKLPSWRSFALALAGPEGEKSPRLLFARQMSRLMVGMAGGVFENGGLTLDRLSGIPLIPGSAVKGCARRAILSALQEWTAGVLKPGDAANPLSPLIEGSQGPADLLVEVALVFGWSDLEWQGRENFRDDKEWEEKRPDFAWACGEQWQAIRKSVSSHLCEHLRITPEDAGKPWENLPHFAGTISFLPAYPWDKDPGIDLDVITCHHGEYYKEPKEPDLPQSDPKWQRWKRDHDSWQQQWGNAPDTEEPVPVIFPAIAPGHTWAFLLHPTPRAQDSHLIHARRWLAHGLEIFGIGAKTNAGYGWFQTLFSPSETPKNVAATLLPPPPESDAFLKTWGSKKLNSFSANVFIQNASEVQSDGELLRIFQALAPEQLCLINTRDPFWSPFLTQPKGKVLLDRIKNTLSTS